MKKDAPKLQLKKQTIRHLVVRSHVRAGDAVSPTHASCMHAKCGGGNDGGAAPGSKQA